MDALLRDLNEPQQQAVAHVDGPMLVLAGAGSGKTRVITRRVAYLIAQGIDPGSVLAITFTNKAAGEMRERVAALQAPPGATLCTFHSLCARLLREYGDLAGLARDFSIYDRDDQIKIAKEAMNRCSLPDSFLTPARAHGAISRAKNQLLTPEAYEEQAADFAERHLAAIYRAYQTLLAENQALDFDDLLMRVALLMRQRPDLRESLGRRFQYVLIDEYQDTNRAQYLIAHGIALDHGNLCVTGDPDQSIYAWRGADIHNILDFEKDYPEALVIRLEENYRSVQPILTAASNLIDHNTQRKAKKLFTRKTGGQDVRVVLCDNERAEAEQIALRIREYREQTGSCSDVAVFYRVNSVSRILEEALMRVGLPYRIARGTEFYNRKEIKDVLAYLKLLVNPADDLSCLRIINTPTRGIGATTVGRLSKHAALRGEGLLDAVRAVETVGLGAAATKKVRAFADLVAGMSESLALPVRQIIENVYHRSGLENAFSGSDEDARQARANVEELISSAAEFDEDNPDATLADYLQQVALVSDIDRFEGGQGAVTLMTLHAAKGLEFPVVFIVGCEEGLLPFVRDHEEAVENPAQLEEERRLAFVGMTRAQQQLTLSCARNRMVRGRTLPQTASRFLEEIGDGNVTREDLTTPILPRRNRFRGGFYEDTREREVIEAMADDVFDEPDDAPPPEYEYLRTGCLVRHPRFGVGKLVKLSGRWPRTRADILFEEYGKKRIVLSHVTLELVEEW